MSWKPQGEYEAGRGKGVGISLRKRTAWEQKRREKLTSGQREVSGFRKCAMEAHRPRKGWVVPPGFANQVSGDLYQDISVDCC